MELSAEFTNPSLQKKIYDQVGSDYLSHVEVEVTVTVKLESYDNEFHHERIKEIVGDAIKAEYDLPTINIEEDY